MPEGGFAVLAVVRAAAVAARARREVKSVESMVVSVGVTEGEMDGTW